MPARVIDRGGPVMTPHPNGAGEGLPDNGRDILLIMVPGMGMETAEFRSQGLIGTVEQRYRGIAVATVDPGLDAYLDGSVEARMLDAIAQARRNEPRRLWLAGVSLGCQAILRCVRAQPDLAEGLILLTPYLASTGLIAEVGRAGGLRDWAAAQIGANQPEAGIGGIQPEAGIGGNEKERAMLTWLATTPPAALPRMFVGRALADRFAPTASLLADLLPAHHVTSVAGEHDWTSWQALWGLILDQQPFERPAPAGASGGAN